MSYSKDRSPKSTIGAEMESQTTGDNPWAKHYYAYFKEHVSFEGARVNLIDACR